jgi:hypothetical protein
MLTGFDLETAEFFETLAAVSTAYVEFGCGESTRYMVNSSFAKIVSVETDLQWAKKLGGELQSNRLTILHCDVGPVGPWGMPTETTSVGEYAELPWSHISQPDTVLIDGRWRVNAWAASMLHCQPGTAVLFDDFLNRPMYFHCAALFPPSLTVGRAAFWRVPQLSADDRADLTHLAAEFSDQPF